MTSYNNPERYARMAEPYADVTEAQAAIDAFIDELDKLREKHRIREVAYVLEVGVKHGDAIQDAIVPGHFGSSARYQALTHYAAGHADALADAQRQRVVMGMREMGRRLGSEQRDDE